MSYLGEYKLGSGPWLFIQTRTPNSVWLGTKESKGLTDNKVKKYVFPLQITLSTVLWKNTIRSLSLHITNLFLFH